MWDQRYSEPGYAYGTQPNEFLAKHRPEIPPGPVLCLAAGEGRNAVFLAHRRHDVTAVDQSAVGLEKAQKLAEERGVQIRTVQSDLADYALGVAKWAGIVSIFAHTPPDIRKRVHADVVRALRPGGIFILEAYRPAQLELKTGGPPTAALMMTAEELRRELDGLELLLLEEVERDITEGRFHSGTGAVVQLIGRKP